MRGLYQLLFLALILFCGCRVNAQSHHLKVFGGTNISTLGNKNYDYWKLGPSVGFGYEVRFTDMLFLEIGAVYNERGAKQSYEALFVGENLQGDYPPAVFRHHYLSIPVAFGIRSRGNFALFGQVGSVFSKILQSTLEYVTASERIDMEFDNTHHHPKVDLTAMLSTGVVAKLGNRIEGIARLTFELGINNTLGVSGGDPHIGLVSQIGLSYRMGWITGG